MSRRFVSELTDGDAVEEVYVVADKQLRANRNANLYLLVHLRDNSGTISARQWNVTEQSVANIDSGAFVKVAGKVQVFQGALQMILNRIEPVPQNGLDPADFLPQPKCNVGGLVDRLKEILLGVEDPHVRSLLECYLNDETFMQGFCKAPAGTKAHHAYLGGLIEHVVNMLEVADRIGDLYPQVDDSLLKAGAFLHDGGKIRELGYEETFIYTDEGQLLGHLVIGVEMLTEKIAEVSKLTGEPFPEETALRLKHLILSHHGTYAFGSPKLPMTPEAIALHHIDNLDAKVNEFAGEMAADPNVSSHWTSYNQRLGRKLFRGAGPAPKDETPPVES